MRREGLEDSWPRRREERTTDVCSAPRSPTADAQQSIDIQTSEDWGKLRAIDATEVIDPTVLKAGQLFLLGRRRAGDRAWRTIRANSRVAGCVRRCTRAGGPRPGLDYRYSYGDAGDRGEGDALAEGLDTCSEDLVPVTVGPNVWSPIVSGVLERMTRAHPVPEAVSQSMHSRLQALDWTFDERLSNLDISGTNVFQNIAGEPKSKSFLYAALTFAVYAQELSGSHVLPTDAAGLLMAAGFGEEAGPSIDRVRLFDDLARLCETQGASREQTIRVGTPAFLPYLLQFHPKTHTRNSPGSRSINGGSRTWRTIGAGTRASRMICRSAG